MAIDPLAVVIVIMLALIIISFRLSAMLLKRAICTVVEIFRQNNAIQFENARTLEELGLGPRPLLSFRIWRDYKPYALKVLAQSSIVRATPDNRFYLIEENPSLGNVSCPVNVRGVKSSDPWTKALFKKGPTYPLNKK